MKAFSLSLLLCTLGFPLGSLAKPGGWGSSGGGSGVACFTNKETAAKADAFIDNSLPLSQELKTQIKTLDTLDYWEWAQTKPFALMIDSDMTADQIIRSMQSRMQYVAPLFTFRLHQSAHLIDVKNWFGKTSLPRIYDANLATKLPAHCRLVQLVARYSGDKRVKRDGPSLHVPVLRTEYNEALFAKLSPMNQAVLRIHEQMYLMGQATGQNSSDVLRPLVMRFFAGNFVDETLRRKLRHDLVKGLSDHSLFFGEDLTVHGEVGTQESRFISFYELSKITQAREKACYASEGLTYQTRMTEEVRRKMKMCLDKAMDIYELQNLMDGEMAFVFMVYYFFDISEHRIEAEDLIAPIQDERYKSYARMHLADACTLMDDVFDRYDQKLEPLLTNAGDYCANLFPMGINRN